MLNETNELIRGLCRQRRQAQERLLQLYGDIVFGQVSRIVPRQEDAEEVYQDVFVKAFRYIRSYDLSKASLATWLSRIAYHESLNYMRHNKSPILYIDDREVDFERISEEAVTQVMEDSDEQTTQLLERALDHLSPEEQAIIGMFYFDEKSIKEISYITDTLPSTIGSQLSRTRKKLYHIIKQIQ
ncbi:MAG: sigma-70 family RNA polymerase sigma factor [Prevotella sp.]|nr:sigma-70 family RNA polymerase sigma factor [Prevotella sp.]